jgi:two-component system, NarL family, nitrate/nitrite response regulator NarL
VIADDHPIVLRGLQALLESEEDFQIVAQCKDGVDALAAVRTHRPDVLLLDIRMPVKDGLQVLRELGAEGHPVRVVLLTVELPDEEVLKAIQLGVRGMLLKEMMPQLLVQCVRKVHAGQMWLERVSAARTFETLLRREAGVRELSALLTPREMEFVRKAVQGLRNKALAEVFHVSEGTVKTHLHSIYEKLQVKSRAELIVYCREKGIT